MPNKPVVKNITIDKESILKAVAEQLQIALPILKEQIGEKKFERRIKKVAKILVAGIKKVAVKKSAPAAKKAPLKKKKDVKVLKAVKVTAKK